MSKESITSELFRGSGIIILGQILKLGIGFTGYILIARFLGQVILGEISLGLAITELLAIVAVLGMDTGVTRYLPRGDSDKYKINIISIAYSITLVLSIVLSFLVLVKSQYITSLFFDKPESITIVRIFAIGVPIIVLRKISLATVRGLEDTQSKVIIADIIQPVSRFLFISVAIIFGMGSIGISLSYVGSFLIAGVGLLWVVLSKYSLDLGIARPANVDGLLSFSFPLALTSIMTYSFSKVDRFFISYYGNTGDVGVYTAIYQLGQLLPIVLMSFNYLFLPMVSKIDSENNNQMMAEVYHTITKWGIIFTLPILMLFVYYPRIVINYTYGDPFITGKLTLVILAVGVFSHVLFGLNRSALKAIGNSKIVTIGTFIVFIVNIILNVLLIPEYLILGAAIATSSSYLVWNLFYSSVIWKITGITPFDSQTGVFFVFIMILYTSLWIIIETHTLTQFKSIIIFFSISSITYPILIVKMGIVGEEEMNLINNIKDRIKGGQEKE